MAGQDRQRVRYADRADADTRDGNSGPERSEAPSSNSTRNTRNKDAQSPDTEDGSRRVAVVTGGAGAIGGAIRVGFRAIAKPYRYGVRLPVCSSSRDPGELL